MSVSVVRGRARWWSLGLGARAVLALAAAACGSGAASDAGYVPSGAVAADAGLDATESPDADAAIDVADDVAAPEDAPDEPALLGPPYPIVLAHGFFGFNDFAGAGFLTYFYGVKDHLAAQGEKLVYTPTVDPFNSSANRGAQLYAAIEQIRAETGKAKVVIIGHSQGGLDARVVAHDHPDVIAAVITVATPHEGSPVADAVLGLSGPIAQSVLDGIGKLLGATINPSAGSSDSVITALSQFSSKEIPAFNAAYPDAPGIPYWSIAGRSFLSSGGSACDVPNAPPWISKWSAARDPCNPLLAVLAGSMIGQVNDGLVPLTSAQHGTFLGCLPADHLDEIGQLLGQKPGIGNPFDYLDMWTNLAGFVRAQGL